MKTHLPSLVKNLLCVSSLAAMAAVSGSAQTTPNFGPNVYIITPSMTSSAITTQLTALSNEAQFSTNRYAVLFMPGTYSVYSNVGFYESIVGLGQTPSAVTINGGLVVDQTDSNGNVTTNFWRSEENLAQNPQGGELNGQLQWGVSQGTSLRRVTVNGAVELANLDCGYASGGFISDTQVTGTLAACSQQQWYTRNSQIGNFTGGVWNYVFSGVQGAPAQSFPSPPDTTLATTPVSREKPFLYVDSSSNFNVFVPALRTASTGTSWGGGGFGPGTSLPISSFFIAQPSNTIAQINAALASGQNLILTPGIYQLSSPITVTNANTIVLGMGYATLVPTNGNATMTVADVDGVQIAGLIFDAGPVNSPILLQLGTTTGSRASHQANPTSLNDVFFRIGGATAGSATESLEVDSDNVILDNIWAWRADHGTGVGWTANTAANGVVVNGDNVTALGLAVEHYQQSQVLWNGQGGETIFYQSELPYDPPSQSAWMNGTANGYASYAVSSNVSTHTAYGIGVYSYFDQGVNIIEDNAITVPVAAGVVVNDALSVFLSGSGQITHVINGVGGTASTANGGTPQDVVLYGGQACSSNCATNPTAPASLTATAASTTQINLSWTASATTGVTYTVYRSTAAGFTPSTVNQVATGITAITYSDTGLATGTTYYYTVEAVNSAGNSPSSPQASATTQTAGATVPSAPTGLTATAASSSQINLSWTASATTGVTYTVYRSTASGFTASSSTQIATGVTAITYSDTGLTASTTYYYVVEAVNTAGNSVPSGQANATTQTAASLPATPSNLSATDVSSTQINVTWTASTTSGVTYTLYRSTTSGFTPSTSNQLAANLTATSYSDTNLSASTTYYYIVEAVDSVGNSGASAVAAATTQAASGCTSNCTDIVAINAGGTATGTYVADEDFSGGGTAATAATINTANVTNPAPQAVYQTERAGVFTYTIPGLTASSRYNVRLHFAEIYWTQVGQRVFNVAINGTTVLANFDIIAATGAQDVAIVKQFTATANASGQIVVSFTNGTADQPKVSGIEVQTGSTPPPTETAIDAGGAAAGIFVADEDYAGGGTAATTATITTANVTNPAPQAVYQTERAGVFTYTIPGLTAGSTHTVRLHFAEIYWSAVGQRVFNVAINGSTVLANFDIIAAAGAKDVAIVEQFTATANASGQIVISFTAGTADQPKVSGLEVQ